MLAQGAMRSVARRALPRYTQAARSTAFTGSSTQLLAQRRFASSHGGSEEAKEGSDVPWMIGSTLIFGSWLIYITSPSKKSDHGHEAHAAPQKVEKKEPEPAPAPEPEPEPEVEPEAAPEPEQASEEAAPSDAEKTAAEPTPSQEDPNPPAAPAPSEVADATKEATKEAAKEVVEAVKEKKSEN